MVKSVTPGFVSYSIYTKDDIENGAVIDAEARIIFNVKEPIDTPTIFHTIDVSKPTSTVNVLPATTNDTNFKVSWSGSDNYLRYIVSVYWLFRK